MWSPHVSLGASGVGGMNGTDHLLAIGATARISRLLTQDTILGDARLRFVQRMDARNSPLAELAVCQWCVSIWIGVPIALAFRFRLPGVRVFCAALTYSMAAGLVSELTAEAE